MRIQSPGNVDGKMAKTSGGLVYKLESLVVVLSVYPLGDTPAVAMAGFVKLFAIEVLIQCTFKQK